MVHNILKNTALITFCAIFSTAGATEQSKAFDKIKTVFYALFKDFIGLDIVRPTARTVNLADLIQKNKRSSALNDTLCDMKPAKLRPNQIVKRSVEK